MTPPPERGARAAAWSATAWVVVFVGFHVHWFLGGHLGRGDQEQTYPVPSSAADYVYAGVVAAMFVVGALLPLCLTRPWGRRLPARPTRAALVLATVILTLRGTAGLVDTVVRETGLATNGITGLTYEEITGSADPTAYTVWSGVAIDVNFVVGGLLFGWTALRFTRARGRTQSAETKPVS